jgi:hypothetical protein
MGRDEARKSRLGPAVSLIVAVALGVASWRIGSVGDAAIERTDRAPRAAAKADASRRTWKLGTRSWGNDSDGDEHERRRPESAGFEPRPKYDGLDVAGGER